MVNLKVELQTPSIKLAPSFQKFKEALRANGDPIWDLQFALEGESDVDFVERCLRRRTHPEPPLVAETIYWGVIGDTAVGRISLRHELNENLKKMGGHIGYEVHPGYRNQGVARTMLKEILLTPKAIEIGKLLLTCHPDNIASNKTIIANGGVFEKKFFVDSIGEYRNHYWISV